MKKNYLNGTTDALYFDGNDWFGINFSSLYGNFYSDSFTFYAVVKPESAGIIFENYWGLGVISGGTGMTPYLSFESTTVLSGDTIDNSEFAILGITVSTINLYNNYMQLRVNGLVYTGVPTYNILLPKYEYLGGDYYDNFTGHMLEALYYYWPLYDDTSEKLEGYLAHKYGITSVLPPSHPYKSSPPIY